jgi:hypothetical protein
MIVIQAKILDSTHLELRQPILAKQGKDILISIPDESEEDHLWQDVSKKHFLEAYSDHDAIYDQL